LKPENILLDRQGNIKLADFGICKVLKENEFTNSMTGTASYMAPEQVLNQGYNFKIDIWSLGCCLYEIVSGYPPYCAENTEEIKS